MAGNRKGPLKISFNSPVILGFTIICFVALMLDKTTAGKTTLMFFSEYHSSLLDPLTYVRFIGHIFGHAGWDHFAGNAKASPTRRGGTASAVTERLYKDGPANYKYKKSKRK